MNHDNTTQLKQHGFTLIELMLAMTFISLLLLAIAMTTIQISNIYNKGLTMKSVNQTGRSISAGLKRDIVASSPFNINNPSDASDITRKYIKTDHGGRLCLGAYSYVWNYGKTITSGSDLIQFNDASSTPVVFARVTDKGGQVCADPASKINKTEATELLAASGGVDLVLHNFVITQVGADTISKQALYDIHFQLGTNSQETLSTVDSSCRPPADKDSDQSFCAVNIFDVIARAGGEGK